MDEFQIGTTAVDYAFVVAPAAIVAFLTGQALANGWQPLWKVAPYAVVLAFANRFMDWALFNGDFETLAPYFDDWRIAGEIVFLFVLAVAAHRMTASHKIVRQYPWLYRRAGPFGWREK
jgi:branched-chain amino acid transport system ATP-binding protein